MAGYLHDGLLIYLGELVDWETYFRQRKGDDVDVEAERAALIGVLETCAEICAQIEPEAREGWDQPVELVDGEPVPPPHIQAGYERLREGEPVPPPHIQAGYERLREVGLVALPVREEYGGFQLPSLISNMTLELISRADTSLMTIMGLQGGIAQDIQEYGSKELCDFVTGELQGSMDLTEAQAGSDLGGIVTRATEEDGRCFLDGEKIFITNGGAEIHLVLARDDDSFDQSKGTTKGLSLYLCPRTLPDGTPNAVFIDRLEHKLGIHGSPTAVVRFDHAEAFRLAEKGKGFKAMLHLMNQARLGVAAQGIGIAEAATEEAIRYSKERKQFGMPIGEQPLMKNMLARMVLNVEGSRALLYRCAVLVDQNQAIEAYMAREKDLGEAERAELQRLSERNEVRIRLLTPLAKYVATEYCDEITRLAVQVLGGVGFMAESVVGKLHLDGIITTIYEGTSEIQVSFALKEIGKGALQTVFEELQNELGELTGELVPLAEKVRAGIELITKASPALLTDFSYALLCSRLEAEMVSHVIVATELLKQAQVAPQRLDLAASWVNRKLLEVEMHAKRISTGDVDRVTRCESIIGLFE
jgi:alkylation response protein AidB-like acyl-CoA dehydrogenase